MCYFRWVESECSALGSSHLIVGLNGFSLIYLCAESCVSFPLRPLFRQTPPTLASTPWKIFCLGWSRCRRPRFGTGGCSLYLAEKLITGMEISRKCSEIWFFSEGEPHEPSRHSPTFAKSRKDSRTFHARWFDAFCSVALIAPLQPGH